MVIKNNTLMLFIVLATITQIMYFAFLLNNKKQIEDKTELILQKEEKLENLIHSLYLYTDSINSKLAYIESQKTEVVTINNTYVQNSERIYHLNPEDSYLLFSSWLSKIDTIRGR